MTTVILQTTVHNSRILHALQLQQWKEAKSFSVPDRVCVSLENANAHLLGQGLHVIFLRNAKREPMGKHVVVMESASTRGL